MNRLKLLLVALVVSVLISCDPMVLFHKVIVNDSDYDLWIMKSDSFGSGSSRFYYDSVLVRKHAETDIYHDGGIGKVSEFPDCSGRTLKDSFFCRINGIDTLLLKIDLNDLINWNYNSLEDNKYGGGTVTCKLIVDNDDIE